MSITASSTRVPRSGSPARQMAAVSGNCVSTTTSVSFVESQPIVPPFPVKIPTPRRSGRNAVTSGVEGPAGVATGTIGLDTAGTWAESEERASRPAEARSDERTMKSRRFMPRRLTTNGR